MALSAFSVAIVSGMLADKPIDSILTNALIAMLIGQIAGYALGRLIGAAYAEALRGFEQSNPIPDLDGEGPSPEEVVPVAEAAGGAVA